MKYRPGLGAGERMKTIAVGSGKGGVGKTTVTSNLAVTAAQRGLRVVALDADYGLGNLNLHLGLHGSRTIEDVLFGRCNLDQALQKHHSGLHVLAGCSGSSEMANLSPEMAKQALSEFDHLEEMTDVMFIDVAAGVHETALATLAAADIVLLVVTPDPSSFVDAFATVKLLQVYGTNASISVVVNQADTESGAKLLFARFQTVVKERLGLHLDYRGYLLHDAAIRRTGSERAPIVQTNPNSTGGRLVNDIADSLFGSQLSSTHTIKGSFLSRLFGKRSQLQRVA